jgi:hypothetical protein
LIVTKIRTQIILTISLCKIMHELELIAQWINCLDVSDIQHSPRSHRIYFNIHIKL